MIRATHFLDIGANIGVYSVYLSGLKSITLVDAFEPAEDSYRILTLNQSLQPGEKIKLHALALSDKDETAEFAIYGELSGNNALVSTTAKESEPSRVDLIECVRLDGLAPGRGRIFVCKIDVEGHEIKAITGARDFLVGNTGFVQIECFENNWAELTSLMQAYGYRFVFRIQNDLYFSNIVDASMRSAILEILYSEVALALDELKQFKISRQQLNWAIREALNAAGHTKDPILV